MLSEARSSLNPGRLLPKGGLYGYQQFVGDLLLNFTSYTVPLSGTMF
jgi:hypothetical protein